MPEIVAFLIGFAIGAAWGRLAQSCRITRGTAICSSYPIAWLTFVGIAALLEPVWNERPHRSLAGYLIVAGVFAVSFAITAPFGCWIAMRSRTPSP